MSWRDDYDGIGKFRNAEFLVKSADTELGRRNAVHEYPLRNTPYTEDLGLKARQFSFDAFVIGDDYHIDRDALMAELEKAGPGTLVHPYLGTMRVSLINARTNETNQQGGRCRFTLTFIIAGANTFPNRQIDTQAKVQTEADVAQEQVIDDFSTTFNDEKLQANHFEQLQNSIQSVLADIDDQVGEVIDPITALIRPPFNLGTSIIDSINRIGQKIAEPFNAIKLYTNLFGIGDDRPTISTATISRKQQTISTQAVHDLATRGALIEACRSSSEAEYDSLDDAINIRNGLLAELDLQMHADNMSDCVYQSLLNLRVAIIDDIRTRGADLPKLNTHTPLISQSALVIAHQLYGDAGRDSEIIRRNNVRHPGFVSGGDALEVLNV
ncbi:MAG: DNA circularization N-terminal domain-containing protein [Methylophaga sp.]|nr:DNA circularization N-terminal domain-containing protein [Methylophaga sp.]